MEVNIYIISLVVVLIIILLILFLRKNAKDKKAMAKGLNEENTELDLKKDNNHDVDN